MSDMDDRNLSPNGFAETAKELSRNPLGIFGLFLVLIYGITAIVFSLGTSFTDFQRNVLTAFLVGFPVLLLAVFYWLVTRHSTKLFAPSDFRDDANYLTAVRVAAVATADKLSKTDTTQEQVHLTIASAEVKMLPAGETARSAIELAPEVLQPRPEWKRANYEFAYTYLLRMGENETAEAISDAYLSTEQAGNYDNAVSWNAYRLLVLIRSNNERTSDNFDALKKLAESNSRVAKVQDYLAIGYAHYGEFDIAAGILQQAASQSPDTDEIANLLGRAAVYAAKAGNPGQAEQAIEEIKKTPLSELQHQTLLRSIKNVAEIVGDNDAAIAVLERIIDENPGDSDTRFSLAFKHSAHGNRDMALIHYLRIPEQERSAAAWNNLGVELDYWRLPAKAVDAFKAAEEIGETLAAANLADKLISAGFIEEAHKRCDTAMKEQYPHSNVSAALARLQEVPQAEDKRLAGITEKARAAVDFYKKFANAIFRTNLDTMASVWDGPQCELNVTLEAEQFTAVGVYELPTGGGILGALMLPSSMPPERFTIQYSGRIKGHCISGTVTRKGKNSPPATLLAGAANEPVPFQILVAESGRELSVMEARGNNRLFYVWKVKERQSSDEKVLASC